MKTVYMTDDGTLFDTEQEAIDHENRVITKEQAMTDFKDYINKALILAKKHNLDLSDKSWQYNEPDVIHVLSRLVQMKFDMNKYYSSACGYDW